MLRKRLSLVMTVNLFHIMAHIYPYFLPILTIIIRDDIILDYTQTALLAMTSSFVMIPLTVLLGFIGDRLHRWRLELIAVGFLLTVSHTFIMFAAQTYGILIVAAVVGGIGASIFHPMALPMLSQEFGEQRNVAHSVNLVFGTIGSIITPLAAINFASRFGWRETSLGFGIFGVACLPILLVMLYFARKDLQYKPHKSVIMEEEVYTVEEGKYKKFNRKLILAAFTGPVIALLIAQVFRSGIFRILNIFTALIFEDQFAVSELGSSIIMSSILALGGLSALVSGFVSKKSGSLRSVIFSKIATTITAVLLVVFVGTLMLTGTAMNTGFLVIAIILFVLLSTTFYFGNAPFNSLLAECVPLEVLSTVTGILDSAMSVFSVALVAFGMIIDEGYTFPYEFVLIIIFALVPLLLFLYVKSKIGLKTPKQVEKDRSDSYEKMNGINSE
ncbi:MAG: MFS transporter [Candidatus Heimdallarchaeota archaeon]|nr:MFS transporter [Candidatus Heimdallarchaeota archaeon]